MTKCTPSPRRHGNTNYCEQKRETADQSHHYRKHEDVERLPLVQLHLGVEEWSGYHGVAGCRPVLRESLFRDLSSPRSIPCRFSLPPSRFAPQEATPGDYLQTVEIYRPACDQRAVRHRSANTKEDTTEAPRYHFANLPTPVFLARQNTPTLKSNHSLPAPCWITLYPRHEETHGARDQEKNRLEGARRIPV